MLAMVAAHCTMCPANETGPKGVGALYVRRRPRVRLEPIMSGGGQERGLRSGTLPTPIVVGFGAACDVAQQELPNDERWVGYLAEKMRKGIEEVTTGTPACRSTACDFFH